MKKTAKKIVDGVQIHILEDGSFGIASMKKKSDAEMASIFISAAQIMLSKMVREENETPIEKAQGHRLVVPKIVGVK